MAKEKFGGSEYIDKAVEYLGDDYNTGIFNIIASDTSLLDKVENLETLH